MLSSIAVAGLSLSTYWMAFALGLIGMLVLCLLRAERYKLPKWKAALFSLLLAICGLIGTKLLYILENWRDTLENGVTLGGQSFFGAVFLVPPLIAVVGLLLRMKPLAAVDYSAPPVALMITAMRFGCFLNGCCGGIEIQGVRIPTQLIESFGDVCILIFLLQTETKKAYGQLFPYFACSYAVLRFCIEFVRDTEKDWLIFSHGQVFSLLSLVIGLVWIILLRKRGFSDEKKIGEP